MRRKELKKAAKKQLKGHWLWATSLFIVSSLIISLINSLIEREWTHNQPLIKLSPVEKSGYSLTTTLAAIFITTIILWGITYSILAFRDNTANRPNILKATFAAFRKGVYFKTVKTSFLMGLFTALWTLLLIVPGIIKGYSYAMTPYILKDLLDSGKKITATQAITQSRKLMSGHKGELFILDLSFIGWAIINIVLIIIGIVLFLIVNTFSPGVIIGPILFILGLLELLWLNPYYRQTKANYYRQLAQKQFIN